MEQICFIILGILIGSFCTAYYIGIKINNRYKNIISYFPVDWEKK